MLERITIGKKEIVLIGTAHISHESVDLVRDTIELEQPDNVAVELCEARYAQLINKSKWENTKISNIIREGKSFLFLSNIMLSNFQKQLGDKVGTAPGSEMMEAIRVANENNATIVLADRNVQTTLKRAFNLMSMGEKLHLLQGVFSGIFADEKKEIDAETIETLKNQDMINHMMNELSKEAPTIKRVLVDERDQYIANKIMNAKGKKIVAVVGAGHMQGIIKHLNKKVDIEELEIIPQKTNWIGLALQIGVPLLLVGTIAFLFYTTGDINSVINVLTSWVLVTGIFAAIGAAIALAHPFTIIAAFLAAPITTLHPAIAVGMVTGAVEAKFSQPRVIDFQKLGSISSISDLWKNKVAKVVLVILLTNLGATIGVLFGIPLITSLLL